MCLSAHKSQGMRLCYSADRSDNVGTCPIKHHFFPGVHVWHNNLLTNNLIAFHLCMHAWRKEGGYMGEINILESWKEVDLWTMGGCWQLSICQSSKICMNSLQLLKYFPVLQISHPH